MFVPVRDLPVGELLSVLASRLPHHQALVYPQRSWTFSELDSDCDWLASALWKLGIRSGDRVAVWSPNVPQWVQLQFALARLGAILVTVNTSLRSHELGYLLRQSGSRALFLARGFRHLDYLEELRQAGPIDTLEHVVVMDASPRCSGFLNWRNLLVLGDGNRPEVRVNLDDCINMQYTSGTTGFPKGVRLSSRNIVNNGYGLGQALGYTPADRLCLCVPFFHCFGCVIGVLASYTHGACLCPVEAFDPLTVLQTVEERKCTALYGVPTMFLAELEHPRFAEFDLTSLRTGVMAGSLCPEPLMRRVMEQMHLKEMTIAYGLTESSPAITITPRHDSVERRTQTVGKVLPELEVRVVDPQSGEVCPCDTPGELQVRGYNVMLGYHDDPEATARTILPEGWLRTGDQATLDAEGYVRITGRLKDIIIRGGENISPKEVEDVLRTHPLILDAAVYAVADSFYGEKVAASLRSRSNVRPGVEEIQEFCRSQLAHFKVPEAIRWVEEFPLTASGKVQKFRLRELHEGSLTV